MKKQIITGLVTGMTAALTMLGTSALAQATPRHAATVTLDGDWYLQSGTVFNQSDEGVAITGLVYSMGAQIDGAGVWERYFGGGQQEQPLAGTTAHYTTQAWSALSVASQTGWSFGGLDLDRIIDAATGVVDSQNLDFSGDSLRHAYVEVTFSDGYRGRAALAPLSWAVTQTLCIGEAVAPVPEPGAGLMLLTGLGVVARVCHRRGRPG